MTPRTAPASSQVAEMRRVFDATFARPARSTALEEEQLLAVRVGGTPCALRVAELSGIVPAKTIAPLPGCPREALGLAGIRGTLVPVYSLAALLSEDDEHERPGWLALCNPEQPIALAFANLEGYLRVAASQLYARDGTALHSRQLVKTGTLSRAVIDIPSVVEAIKKRVGPRGPQE